MKEKECQWADLRWEKKLIIHRMHKPGLLKQIREKKREKAEEDAWIAENTSSVTIRMPVGKGKVTDAGYDNFSCFYTKIPAGEDLCFEAEITVDAFLHEPGSSGQEAFGMFVRDTMSQDRGTGAYYSNMAAVGGYYGRFNVFGRCGITKESIARIDNFFLYRKVNRPGGIYENDPLHYQIASYKPQRFRISISLQGRRLFAQMLDSDGRDVLHPEINGGRAELSDGVCKDELLEGYGFDLASAFRSRGGKYLYIGFFAADGSQVTVHKETVRLKLTRKSKVDPFSKRQDCPEETDGFAATEWSGCYEGKVSGQIWYASADGKQSGDGSRGKPWDIYTAIEQCGCGDRICLAGGTYRLERPVAIGKSHSGNINFRKYMTGDPAGGRVTLDFCGSSGCLSIQGDFWTIEGIRVTNGYGIQVEGNCNCLKRCVSCWNNETGILIRHHDNASPRKEWPSHNLIEKCAAYGNRDRAECNADGFACKVAAGTGNVFSGCVSFFNSDDGFDLFAKNRAIGTVLLNNCRSYLNGYKFDEKSGMIPTGGNGNGFKLGGSGMYVEHQVSGCIAAGNRRDGFTSNSNPYMYLVDCKSVNNGRKSIHYSYYQGAKTKHLCKKINCITSGQDDFDADLLLKNLLHNEGFGITV